MHAWPARQAMRIIIWQLTCMGPICTPTALQAAGIVIMHYEPYPSMGVASGNERAYQP